MNLFYCMPIKYIFRENIKNDIFIFEYRGENNILYFLLNLKNSIIETCAKSFL